MLKSPSKFLATIQIGITLAGFLSSAFASDVFASQLAVVFFNVTHVFSIVVWQNISIVLITIILSYFTLIFGELVPKRIAMRKSEKIALEMSGAITIISKIFAPIVWLLTASTNGVLRLIGIDPNQQDEELTEEEIRMLLEEGSKKGVIAQDENEIIQNVFELNDLTAGEIATRRTELSMLFLITA